MLWFFLAVIIFGPFHVILGPLLGERASKFLMFITYRIAAIMVIYPPLHWVVNHGREKISKDLSCIMVGNHGSNMDFYINPHTAPMLIRVLVKKELEKIPIFGSVMKAVCISVDRKDDESKKRSLKELRKKLDKGYSVFIYPEGTRNRTDEPLQPFKSGAFRLAIETGLPIAVTTIGNIKQRNDIRNGIFDSTPGPVHVYWDGPISTEGMTMDDVPALKEKVREIMLGHLKKHA